MRYVIRILPILVLVFSVTAFGKESGLDHILKEQAKRHGLRPSSALYIDTDQNLSSVGRRLFESRSVSLNGQISCRDCHLDQFGSGDGIPNAVGIFGTGEGPTRLRSGGKIIPRNTLPLWGRGGIDFLTFFWDGKVDFSGSKEISQFGENKPSSDPLVTAIHLPPVEIREMLDEGRTVLPYKVESVEAAKAIYRLITQKLQADEKVAMQELAAQLGKPQAELAFVDVARAIAAFIRSEFRVKETKFHRFVFGKTSLNEDELQGALIFYGKGKCITCHSGPYFSDFQFHAVPFPQLGFGKNGFGVDYGRFNVTFDSRDLYKFRTPPLFNVDKTAPYGHSGSVATIRQAIIAHFDPLRLVSPSEMDSLSRHEFYKRLAFSAADVNLTSYLKEDEVSQLEAFLKTLSFD